MRDAQKAHTRQRLIEAARAVFRRQGFYGSTVDQIVAEAGASRPTFYLHFRDQDAVLGELMAQYIARGIPFMERLPAPRPTLDELKTWLCEFGTFIEQETASYTVLTEVSVHRQPKGPHYGLATIDAWIGALGHRAPAFAAAQTKADVNARAHAQLLMIDIVWAAANVARDKAGTFTQETVAIVAQSVHDFVNDPRFHSSSSTKTRATSKTGRSAPDRRRGKAR